MKTKFLLINRTLFLIVSVFIIGQIAQAYSFEVNGIYYNKSGNNVYVTRKYVNGGNYASYYKGNVNIPSTVTYEGTTFTVIGIESFAFDACTGLNSVTIPNTVRTIGEFAFCGCKSLTSINIPNSVVSISKSAFWRCAGLNSITIGTSLAKIAPSAFRDCGTIASLTYNSKNCTGFEEWPHPFTGCSIQKVIIGDSVLVIPANFCGSSSITSITIGKSVKSIGFSAFGGCSGLTYLSIPNSVTHIGDNAFSGCSSLTQLYIGNNVKTIGRAAFYNCSNLGTLRLGSSVDTIGESAFYGGEKLKELHIPISVRYIGGSSFSNCKSLNNLIIPNSVTSLGSYAFYQCIGLTSVTIGNSVTSIGQSAFGSCNNISKVIMLTAKPPISAYGMFPNDQLILVPNVSFYQVDSYWKKYNLVGMYNMVSSPTMMVLYGNNNVIHHVETSDHLYFPSGQNVVIMPDILPNSNIQCGIFVYIDDNYYEVSDHIVTQLTFGQLTCDATQTTLNVSFSTNSDYGFTLDACGFEYSSNDIEANILEHSNDRYLIGRLISGLTPNKEYYFRPWVQHKGVKYYGNGKYFSTNFIMLSRYGTVCPTSVDYSYSYSPGDAHVTDTYFTFEGRKYENLLETGLEPNKYYTYYYTLETSSGEQSNSYNFTTPALSMTAKAADMVTNRDARLMAETNMADIETSCGFEWRRYDAPEEMPSAKVYCPVYGGVMAGTLKNMSENVYYKYRPFYKSSVGNEYYGDWVAFITADAGVEFDPVVHTYNSPAVTQTEATLQGVALRGSEAITEQGFEYWKTSNNKTLTAANEVTKVTAKGERMSKTVEGLKAGTKYTFRAYVIAGGETTYGEEVQFVTRPSSMDVNLDGEVNIADVNKVIEFILSGNVNTVGDVNNDGEVNIADINAIIRAILSN